jgi:hypothetical protein
MLCTVHGFFMFFLPVFEGTSWRCPLNVRKMLAKFKPCYNLVTPSKYICKTSVGTAHVATNLVSVQAWSLALGWPWCLEAASKSWLSFKGTSPPLAPFTTNTFPGDGGTEMSLSAIQKLLWVEIDPDCSQCSPSQVPMLLVAGSDGWFPQC